MPNLLLISCLLIALLGAVGFFLIFFKYYNKAAELEKENIFLKAQRDFTQEQHKTAEQKLKLQFENYTEQLLKSKADVLQKEAANTITSLLNPLKDKINEFQQKVERTYQEESREIFSLKNEINKLVVNNFNMAKETLNLTNALKGSVKAQGIWGEIILDKVLEHSGLRDGIEYIKQGSNLQLKNDEDKIIRPDVIINLPDHKHLVIDAKVSLVNYQQHISSLQSGQQLQDLSDNNLEQDHLKLFIKSIQNHITNLSNKNYQHNDQLLSPDFVMLFFPIEGAFSLALQVMPELLTQAFNHKIIIVSPTTLLATLKTIASIWLVDKQNKNAMQIALESGLLYDKFVGFTEDVVAIGQAINKADTCYHAALNKLSQGRGNLIAKAEKIRELGAKAKKKIEYNLQNNLIHSENDNDKYKRSSYNSSLCNIDAGDTEMELGDD